MSKTLKTIGAVVGAVALVATGVGAFAVAGSALAATAGTASTIAGLVAGVANIGSALTQKAPPARGSVTQILIEPDAPQPYLMGETYFAGVMRHDVGYGPTTKKVPNPYRFMATVYSGAGPVQGLIGAQADFGSISSWYSGFLTYDSQLGATPEASSLSPTYSGAPGWASTAKLSGQAAIGWSFKFDKDGKRFASGLPVLGAVWQGVKVYDPRKDSSFPGGSGSHVLGDEATYEYSTSPALHAGMYCYGRYQNGRKVMGIGLPTDGVDWPLVAAWANDCTLNGWEVSGVCFEPGDRWQNLLDICAAGGGQPAFADGIMSFHWPRPRVALDTVTEDDIKGDVEVTAMTSFRDRLNTIVPKYRSPNHNWELIPAESVSVSTYVADDGQVRIEEWPFNFVKAVDQASELAAYQIVDARELKPITLPCGPRLRGYRPGDCLYLDLPQLGLDIEAVILTREVEPATGQVTFTMTSETTAKHSFALGLTGTPPPAPALGLTSEERDELAANASEPAAYTSALIATSFATDTDPFDGLLQATDTSITIESHSRTYSDRTVSVTGATITQDDQAASLLASDGTNTYRYRIYYDDEGREGGAVTFKATLDSEIAVNKSTQPYRHYVGTVTMDVVGGSGTQSGGSVPPGWSGDDYCVAHDTPVLLATGEYLEARQLAVGDLLRTQHEKTLEWGEYPVEAISFADASVYLCKIDRNSIRATAEHRFYIGDQWVTASQIGQPDGSDTVAKITVTHAHTYVSNGILSHNVKADG